MIGKLLLWVRRNSRRAVALALAPGLAALALDAYIEHFIGRNGEAALQWVPVVFGPIGFFLLSVACVLRPRATFTWGARLVGAVAVVVGLWGAILHGQVFYADLDGKWTRNAVEGALEVAPPLFAPMAFALLGGLVLALTSARLSLRIKVGAPPVVPALSAAPLSAAAADSERKTG
jgi:hypothetical protein